MRNPARYKRLLVEPEINKIQIGEYMEDDYQIHCMPLNYLYSPEYDLNFQDVSEEYAEEYYFIQ
jgi:hypothetical protein